MTSAQIDTIQALENENKILADEVKMKEELIPGMEKMIAYLQKVQEENKQLKEEINLTNTALDMVKDENEVNKKNLMNAMEENRKLKGEYDGWKASYDDDIREAKGEKQQEIDELKQEIGEKESSLHYYRCMWHITGCDDLPTKEEVEDYLRKSDLGEDKERIKAELWEMFGHEEESDEEE